MEIQEVPIFRLVRFASLFVWPALALLSIAIVQYVVYRQTRKQPAPIPTGRVRFFARMTSAIGVLCILCGLVPGCSTVLNLLGSMRANDVELTLRNGAKKTVFLSYKREIGEGVSEKTALSGHVPETHIRVPTEPQWREPYILVPKEHGDVVSAHAKTVTESFFSRLF